MQIILSEDLASGVQRIVTRLWEYFQDNPNLTPVWIHSFQRSGFSLHLGLRWNSRDAPHDGSIRLPWFDELSGRLHQTQAFRHLYILPAEFKGLKGTYAEVSKSMVLQMLDAAILNFGNLESTRAFPPDDREDLPQHQPRAVLQNSLLAAFWGPTECAALLKEAYGRGGVFGKADECLLSRVSGELQLFVTSEMVFVAEREPQTVVWEVDLTEVRGCQIVGGQAIRVLTEESEVLLEMECSGEQAVIPSLSTSGRESSFRLSEGLLSESWELQGQRKIQIPMQEEVELLADLSVEEAEAARIARREEREEQEGEQECGWDRDSIELADPEKSLFDETTSNHMTQLEEVATHRLFVCNDVVEMWTIVQFIEWLTHQVHGRL
eukprot:TRINITY_DN14178_c0_g1_i3.p1 TRINITY_DN14178_c0_g1~~TRINITY_DN14178_c0_g1_i3.p1  ORF type:complete len:380 (+),score=102.55 TRINITY_DN14178_c0_g1_i3:259-1398(+)